MLHEEEKLMFYMGIQWSYVPAWNYAQALNPCLILIDILGYYDIITFLLRSLWSSHASRVRTLINISYMLCIIFI